jgi:hypothetical protein
MAGQAVASGSDAELGAFADLGFRSLNGVQGGEDQMPPADERPTGQQPHRRQSRRLRKIDFAQLDSLSTSADQELREAEDARVAFMEQQAKRDALYAGTVPFAPSSCACSHSSSS